MTLHLAQARQLLEEIAHASESELGWGAHHVRGYIHKRALDALKLLAAAAPPAQGTDPIGTWPEHCEQRAFVAGASWWEFESRKATMWGSDRAKAEDEAIRRYGEPESAPAQATSEGWREGLACMKEALASLGLDGPTTLADLQRRLRIDAPTGMRLLAIREAFLSLAPFGQTPQETKD